MASKKILIGVTAILAVAIVVVLAVALTAEGNHTGNDSQNTTIQQAGPPLISKPKPNPDVPQSTSKPPPADATTPSQEEPTTQLPATSPQEGEEYFVRTNNSCMFRLL